ncbi:MAG: glycosyl transferase [Pseudohongiella sp.]|nr:MAG: glycosyl transferase [Pseudohongiella sp.]
MSFSKLSSVIDTVAAIIPTYNRAETLRRALDSVYGQSRRVDEVCVVDDGSIDGTEELLSESYPSAIYIKQENSGVSSARNRGVEATTSHFLAFLDSDDEWLPEKIELQLAALKASPASKLVHGDEIWIRNGKRVNQMDKHRKSGGDVFSDSLALCVISPSAVMLKRSLYTELGGFDESLPACEDYDLWLRICSREKILYIDEPLLRKYGGHDDQLSSKYWGMDRFRVQALDKLLESGELDEDQEALAKAMLLQKADILRNGAVKRGKMERANHYTRLISIYDTASCKN